MSISGYGKRLKEARKHAGLTQSQMGDELGVEWHKIKDMESERLKLSAEVAVEIEQKWSIDGWWLLTGKGEMIPSESKNLPIAQEKHPEDDENTVSLNYYPDIVAAAGYGGINEYEFRRQTMKFDRAFLEQFLNVRRFDCLDVIRIIGDSMEPYIHDGEVVLIERHHEAMNGETVIANVNGHIYVKRFHSDPFGKWVKLVSENHIYGSLDLEGDELEYFSIIGIVRAKIKVY